MNRCPGPGCHGVMVPETSGDVTVDRCPRCGGLWFDAHELDRWFTLSHPNEVSRIEGHIPKRGLSGRQCPRCERSMETAGWGDAVIERCPGCRGLFVEVSEIVLIDRERSEHAMEQRELQLQLIMIDAGWTLLAAGAIARIVMRFM